jgi:hypothetical protein
MKKLALLLLFALPAFSQDSKWVRSQFPDKLTGNMVTAYQLFPDPDGSGRKPYIGITCDQADKRFAYGYFTDDAVAINAQYSNLSTQYYPTTVSYRADSAKPKQDSVTVRADFRTINLDQGILLAVSSGSEFALSFPSERGYQVTDVFAGSALPLQYMGDCYTEKQLKKMAKRAK